MDEKVKIEEPDEEPEAEVPEDCVTLQDIINGPPRDIYGYQEALAILNIKPTQPPPETLETPMYPIKKPEKEDWRRRRRGPPMTPEDIAQLKRLMVDPPVKPKEHRNLIYPVPTSQTKPTKPQTKPNVPPRKWKPQPRTRPSPIDGPAPSKTVQKRKPALQSAEAANPHQTKSDILIKNFFKEAGLKESAAKLNCFQELVHHLNPMLKMPDFTTKPEQKKTRKIDLKEFGMNVELKKYPSCIVCGLPSPTPKTITLTVSDATKILVAAISYGTIKIEKASEIVCRHPLRMCRTHVKKCYEMMCKAVGATCEFDVNDGPTENILMMFETYKHLQKVRDEKDKRPLRKTSFGAFKMMIKTFFKTYTPKHISAREEILKRQKTAMMLQKMPPNARLKDFLAEEKLMLKQDTQEELMYAIANKGSGPPIDLFYKSMEERRTHARDQRYSNYPEEVRKSMKPFDEAYEKQSAASRTEMVTIRQNKDPQQSDEQLSASNKRKRAAPTDFVRMAQSILRGKECRPGPPPKKPTPLSEDTVRHVLSGKEAKQATSGSSTRTGYLVRGARRAQNGNESQSRSSGPSTSDQNPQKSQVYRMKQDQFEQMSGKTMEIIKQSPVSYMIRTRSQTDSTRDDDIPLMQPNATSAQPNSLLPLIRSVVPSDLDPNQPVVRRVVRRVVVKPSTQASQQHQQLDQTRKMQTTQQADGQPVKTEPMDTESMGEKPLTLIQKMKEPKLEEPDEPTEEKKPALL